MADAERAERAGRTRRNGSWSSRGIVSASKRHRPKLLFHRHDLSVPGGVIDLRVSDLHDISLLIQHCSLLAADK